MNDPSKSEWISLRDQPKPCLSANLRALRINQPHLVPAIRSHHDRSHIFLKRNANGLYSCKYTDKRGVWMVHDASRPEDEFQRYFNAMQNAFQKGSWAVQVLGCGMGTILPECARYLEQAHRGEPKGLIVLQQDPGLLCAGLGVYDMSAALKSGRLLFAIGPNLLSAMKEIHEQRHIATLHPDQIATLPGYDIRDPERVKDYQYIHQQLPDLHEAYRENYLRILQQAERHWSKPNAAIQKVWTHVADDRAAGSMLLGLSNGFQEAGLESKALRLKDRLFTRFYQCAFDFFSFQPDAILCVNHSSNYVASFADPVPIPRIVWYVDDPDNTVEVPYHPHDQIVAISDSFKNAIQRRKGNFLGVLPAAADRFFQEPAPAREWKHDISYVGSVVDHSDILNQLDDALLEWIGLAVKTQLENPTRSMKSIRASFDIDADSKDSMIRVLSEKLPKARYMAPDALLDHFLYAEANSKRRGAMMKALRSFESVGIYGPADWRALLPDSMLACHHGPIETNDALEKLYQRSKINLSINSLQGFGFVNPRVFHVPACGGFVLAEYNAGLESMFKRGDELHWFETIEEMAQLIQSLLDKDSARMVATIKAQKRIKAEHTYKIRAETVLGWLDG